VGVRVRVRVGVRVRVRVRVRVGVRVSGWRLDAATACGAARRLPLLPLLARGELAAPGVHLRRALTGRGLEPRGALAHVRRVPG
jgi:hypothetical protein